MVGSEVGTKNMPEKLLPYALTELQRVKDLMSLTNSDFDSVLMREINAVSSFLKKQCNRDFLYQKYISEVHTQWGSRQQHIVLRQKPVFFMTDTVAITGGSDQITLNNINGVQVGMPIAGDGINGNTVVKNIVGNVITLSQPANKTSSVADIFVSGLIDLQYRAGTSDNPQWTKFLPPQFEVVAPGDSGIVRVYGFISSIYNNTIKATYWAGWLIDWDSADDNLKHTLPADITRTCENIVIRWYKRAELAGKSSQSLEGSTIAYRDLLDNQDLQVIKAYQSIPTVM